MPLLPNTCIEILVHPNKLLWVIRLRADCRNPTAHSCLPIDHSSRTCAKHSRRFQYEIRQLGSHDTAEGKYTAQVVETITLGPPDLKT
jgi:hypothetical protein